MVVINGVEYDSKKDALYRLGLNSSTVYRYMSREKCRFEQAVETLLKEGTKGKTKTDQPFTFHNVQYKSFRDACIYLFDDIDFPSEGTDEERVETLEEMLKEEYHFEDEANLFLLGRQYWYISEACYTLSLDFKYVRSYIESSTEKTCVEAFLEYYNRLLVRDAEVVAYLRRPIIVCGTFYHTGSEALKTLGYDLYSIELIRTNCKLNFDILLEYLVHDKVRSDEKGHMDIDDRLKFIIKYKDA